MARRRTEPVRSMELPYELDMANFTGVAVVSLSASERPMVVDELGALELEATDFTAAIAKQFRGSMSALVVIQRRALDRWMQTIGPESVTHLLQANLANRDALPGKIVALFQG